MGGVDGRGGKCGIGNGGMGDYLSGLDDARAGALHDMRDKMYVTK